MTKEDIIRMAREAGCIPRRHPEYDNDIQVFATPDVLERFAALVAAAARAEENEACAKVCEEIKGVKLQGYEFATAIRARGET